LSDLGKQAAYYKWGDPQAEEKQSHSWKQVAEHFDKPRESVRSAARKYRDKHSEEFGDEPKVKFTGTGNTADVTYTGPNFTNVDDLLEHLDIDTEVWNPYWWQCHPYQGFSKNERKNLTFDEGKISGTLKAGGHLVTTM